MKKIERICFIGKAFSIFHLLNPSVESMRIEKQSGEIIFHEDPDRIEEPHLNCIIQKEAFEGFILRKVNSRHQPKLIANITLDYKDKNGKSQSHLVGEFEDYEDAKMIVDRLNGFYQKLEEQQKDSSSGHGQQAQLQRRPH